MFNEDFEKENREVIEKIKKLSSFQLKPDFDEKLFIALKNIRIKRPIFIGKHSWLKIFFYKLSSFFEHVRSYFLEANKPSKEDITSINEIRQSRQTKRHYRFSVILAAVAILIAISFFVYKYINSSFGNITQETPVLSHTIIDSSENKKKSLRIFTNDISYLEFSASKINMIPNKDYWIDLSKDIFSYLGKREFSSTQVLYVIKMIKGKKYEKEIKRITRLKPNKNADRMDTIALYIKLDPQVVYEPLKPPAVQVYPK